MTDVYKRQTYSFYDVWAELFHIPYRCPELDNDFRLVKEDYLTENGGIVIPNPNAPTGLFESLDTIEEIVAGNPDSMVIIDEAYVDSVSYTHLDVYKRQSEFFSGCLHPVGRRQAAV